MFWTQGHLFRAEHIRNGVRATCSCGEPIGKARYGPTKVEDAKRDHRLHQNDVAKQRRAAGLGTFAIPETAREP